MGKTLFDLTRDLVVALGPYQDGVATGGSTSTLVDSVELTQDDDFWNGGTVWINYDAGGAGAAPQGEYSVVSDFTASSDTASLRSTLTAAIGAGDRYTIARKRYPLNVLVSKINEVLLSIPIEKTDTTTITIAVDDTEYSLPSDVWDLKQVWIGDGADANNWQLLDDWRVQKSATGTANVLIFGRQFATSTDVKLVYLTYHQTLRVATDKLDDSIHADRVIYNAAVGCLLWRKAKVGESDSSLNELLNYFQNLAAQMNSQFAVNYPRRAAKTIHLTMP